MQLFPISFGVKGAAFSTSKRNGVSDLLAPPISWCFRMFPRETDVTLVLQCSSQLLRANRLASGSKYSSTYRSLRVPFCVRDRNASRFENGPPSADILSSFVKVAHGPMRAQYVQLWALLNNNYCQSTKGCGGGKFEANWARSQHGNAHRVAQHVSHGLYFKKVVLTDTDELHGD